MTLKLDTSKAYDRVEWSFLEDITRKLGFNEKWITLMITCVKSVSYFILLNGDPKGFIKPTRGIRQRDPFSPFLFLLCTKCLHSLITQANLDGSIRFLTL